MQFFLVRVMCHGRRIPQLDEPTPLLQILDNLKDRKYDLHVQPADTPVAERKSPNYWRMRKCTSKSLEIPPNSPAFTVNFLRSEKMLLPDDFSNIDALEEEVLILGIPELIDAVKIYRGSCSVVSPTTAESGGWWGAAAAGGTPPWTPLFAMALGLLANYPDSALGQLCVGSDLGRSRLHVSSHGVLFQHARCRLDSRSIACSLHQIVKVCLGGNWYETCLQTLLKYPELLSNDKKVCWITCGQSLLIRGDGQMFRHVLSFLRFGKLFLPAEFKLWIQKNELHNGVYFPCRRLSTESWNKELEFSEDPKEVYSFTAVDSSRCCINTWSNIRDLTKKQGSANQQTLLWQTRDVGLILKAEHPPVLGSDGFCACDGESVVYSAQLDGSRLEAPQAQALSEGIVFLTFALSHEEIFYARKCHFFLTDVILDSLRQKDPKEITAKVGTLVNRLWTRQITPREFVADLLNMECFEGNGNVQEELLQWVEVSSVCHQVMLQG
ncbi:BTB/POZ domain-containing protein KCTD19 [Patagioenas fasciata monilis]|uniref:BTB/POZ domain-containing protein KCTD19 n=1 Tax=Patagioenas fasciata monilis TaxID=372326 RepID=A0A1V4K0U5_PATFA|nr:BTB/POZ domain-containing protein KCTD19 [Patagioenas fasciata monilis]